MRSEECGNCTGGLSVTSTADGAMQNVRDVDLLPTKSLFASGSTATTYWTLWTGSISGILLFSEIQTAGTSKRVSVTSAFRNLQNVASYLAVYFPRSTARAIARE